MLTVVSQLRLIDAASTCVAAVAWVGFRFVDLQGHESYSWEMVTVVKPGTLDVDKSLLLPSVFPSALLPR